MTFILGIYFEKHNVISVSTIPKTKNEFVSRISLPRIIRIISSIQKKCRLSEKSVGYSRRNYG